MRKHTKRKHYAPIPPACRPKLTAGQRTELELCHLETLDAIVKGQATENTALQWAGGVLTWANVATALQLGEAEMAEQAAVVNAVFDRYRRLGRWGMSGQEYLTAKRGIDVMSALAEKTDRYTALAAAEASEAAINRLLPCAA